MLGFWKRKAKTSAPSAPVSLPQPSDLSDDTLIGLIRETFERGNEVVGALFLVAYENFQVYFPAFHRHAPSSNKFPASVDGFVSFIAAGYAEQSRDSIAEEMSRRRLFYLYLAALLRVAHARAKAKPELWDSVVDIWVHLLEGARALRRTLDKTALWTPDEIVYFKDIKSGEDGQEYCLSLMVPSEIRYHAKIEEWLERELTAEERANRGATDKDNQAKIEEWLESDLSAEARAALRTIGKLSAEEMARDTLEDQLFRAMAGNVRPKAK